tara:strand:- start:1513 stop:1851 length:339 start_codon:yes stop_codon:yes gene_type:complete
LLKKSKVNKLNCSLKSPFLVEFLHFYSTGYAIFYYYVKVFIYYLIKNLDKITKIKHNNNVGGIFMKRQKQNSKEEYLAKYDKSMGPMASLGTGLVPYTILILSFIAILYIAL